MAIAGLGAAPFAAGILIAHSGHSQDAAARVLCPVRAITGIPCPSCGSGRAFVGLAARDARWQDYNWVAVAYAAIVLSIGVGLNLVPDGQRRPIVNRFQAMTTELRTRPTLSACLAVLAAAPMWAVARRTPPYPR